MSTFTPVIIFRKSLIENDCLIYLFFLILALFPGVSITKGTKSIPNN